MGIDGRGSGRDEMAVYPTLRTYMHWIIRFGPPISSCFLLRAKPRMQQPTALALAATNKTCKREALHLCQR
jgi:hypothetical protein